MRRLAFDESDDSYDPAGRSPLFHLHDSVVERVAVLDVSQLQLGIVSRFRAGARQSWRHLQKSGDG